ncbi:MAG: polysaccharide deacetylase family protein [Dehalococcoidia bacterium]
MAFLVENQVHATIFVTGDIITRTTEGQQVIQTVVAHPELFVLANHSYFHPDFRDLTPAEIAEELQDTEAAIQALGGPDPRPWFRPPFGGYDQEVLDTVGELGYAYTVMWDFDSADWRPESDGGPDADGIVSKVLSNARAGSVVIFHLGGYHTLEALPAIVSALRADGFELVTLPELLQ